MGGTARMAESGRIWQSHNSYRLQWRCSLFLPDSTVEKGPEVARTRARSARSQTLPTERRLRSVPRRGLLLHEWVARFVRLQRSVADLDLDLFLLVRIGVVIAAVDRVAGVTEHLVERVAVHH